MSKIADLPNPARRPEALFRRVILKALCDVEIEQKNTAPERVVLAVFERLNKAFNSLYPLAGPDHKQEFQQVIWDFLQEAQREQTVQTADPSKVHPPVAEVGSAKVHLPVHSTKKFNANRTKMVEVSKDVNTR